LALDDMAQVNLSDNSYTRLPQKHMAFMVPVPP